MNIDIFLMRVIVCFILSLLVGIERQLRHKMVGLRTNVLVCVGSFLFVYLSFGIHASDVTRIAAQVVSGIGFLGAGVILKDGDKIKGLNTAATLWCNAAIGALCASGLLIEATVGTFIVLFSNIILRCMSLFIMNKLNEKAKQKYTININCKKDKERITRSVLINLIKVNSLILESLEKTEITKTEIKLTVILITNIDSKVDELINKMSTYTGILSISWNHQKIASSDNEDYDEE